MSHTATIVFDLDGTLADTAPDLIATLNFILVEEGLKPVPLDRARDLVGAGGRALLERGIAANDRTVSAAHLDTLYQRFLEVYAGRIAVESRLFPGVAEALERFEAAGWRLAVCTNKVERHSVMLLEALGIAPRFHAICGRDTFPFFKPDPRHLTMTIEAAGGVPDTAVMVGDSQTDIATAKAAGIPVVAVPFGYTMTPVSELDPDIIIEHFDHLWDAATALSRRASLARS